MLMLLTMLAVDSIKIRGQSTLFIGSSFIDICDYTLQGNIQGYSVWDLPANLSVAIVLIVLYFTFHLRICVVIIVVNVFTRVLLLAAMKSEMRGCRAQAGPISSPFHFISGFIIWREFLMQNGVLGFWGPKGINAAVTRGARGNPCVPLHHLTNG